MHTRQLPLGGDYRPLGHSPRADGHSPVRVQVPDPAATRLPAQSPSRVHAPVRVHTPVTHITGVPVWRTLAPTNSPAIAALVLSLISFTSSFFLAGIAGIICGHIARSQIRSRGERGNGMAVAALWLGYLSTIFWILFWLIYFGIAALVIGLALTIAGSAGTLS